MSKGRKSRGSHAWKGGSSAFCCLSPAEGAKLPAKPREKPPEPEESLVGKRVEVPFHGRGLPYSGPFPYNPYTFVLACEGRPLLTYKHVVKVIEEVLERGLSRPWLHSTAGSLRASVLFARFIGWS